MKLSRTAIKELKARYLDILKKCAYLNAVIIASSLAVNAASATTLGEFARSEGDGVFDISVQGTENVYTVTDIDNPWNGGLPVSEGNKVIQGADSTLGAINRADYVLAADGLIGVFVVPGPGSLTIRDLTIQNMMYAADIREDANVTFNNVAISGIDGFEQVYNEGIVDFINTSINGSVENAGVLTASASAFSGFEHTGGTATLTSTQVNGTLDETGGMVNLDDTTVADKTTVGVNGTLSAINNTTFADVENAGVFTATGGSLTSLTNTGGTATLTDAAITGVLDVMGGTVDLEGSTVEGKTTVDIIRMGSIKATNASLQDVENGGSFTAINSTMKNVSGNGGRFDITGGSMESFAFAFGTAILKNTQINGELAASSSLNLTDSVVGGNTFIGSAADAIIKNSSLQHVENEGPLEFIGGSLASLSNKGGTATLTSTQVNGILDVTGGTVNLDAANIADKTTVGADGTLSATNGTTFAAVENSGVFKINGGSLESFINNVWAEKAEANLISTRVNDFISVYDGTTILDNSTVLGYTLVGRAGKLTTQNNTILSAVDIGEDAEMISTNTIMKDVVNYGDFVSVNSTMDSLFTGGMGGATVQSSKITGELDVESYVELDATTVGGKTTLTDSYSTLLVKNNSKLSDVENTGRFTATGSSLASLTNTANTATLTSAHVDNTITATGGTVNLNDTVVISKTTVGTNAILSATEGSSLAGVENAGSFTATDSTLESLSNTDGTATLSSAHVDNTITATGGTVNLDDTVVISKTTVGSKAKLSATNGTSLAGVENAGTFIATDSTLESLSNTDGAATLTSTQVKGSLAITGGDVDLNGSIINGKTTVGTSGTLLATNNTSLSAVENAGTLDAKNATMQGLTNSGDLTILGGSLASLANTGGKADLTSTQITGALGITGGDVVLTDSIVGGKTTIASSTNLTADRTSLEDVAVSGNFMATDSTIAGLTNEFGTVTLTDTIVNGLVSTQGKVNLAGDIQLTGGVSGTGSITNSGNLILGAADNTKYVGAFNQTDGKTVADSENFFQDTNTISGGILETKGDTIGYTATATGNGTISFEAMASDVVHSANNISLSNDMNGSSVVSFKNGSYTLNDMGSGTSEDLVKFDNAIVQLTANDYAGETYSFNDTTIDLRGNGLSNIQFTGDNLALSNTDLAFDVKLSITDGFLALDSDTITVSNASNTASFDLDLTKVQIINNVQLDSGLTTSVSKKVLEGVTFNTPTNSALVSTDVYQYNVSADDQTINLTSIQAANGDSLKTVNQYVGDSAFYMTNLDSRYEMSSALGGTGTGNKLIQGYVDGTNIIKSTIDANSNSMFDVTDQNTILTVKDVAITNASSVLKTAQGAGTTTFENVWIHNTTNIGLENGNLVANPIISNTAGDDTTYGLVLKNVLIQDTEDLVENSGSMNVQNSTLKGLINSGRFNAENATLTSVENSGSFTTNGGSIYSFLNLDGNARLTDTAISTVLDVMGGDVDLTGTTNPLTVGGKTTVARGRLNATNVAFKDVENSGFLTSYNSVLGSVTNNAVLSSLNSTIESLTNTGVSVLKDSTVTTLNNSNTLTAEGGVITTLTNQEDGSASLTGTTVGALIVNKGTVTATGGSIETLNNAQDGNTTLSGVTNVDTITNDGNLTSSNSKLSTVTNNNSLTSIEDTITSLDNIGTASLTGSKVTTLTNSGTLTAKGGSITILTNQDGTAGLTDTALTNLNVNAGSVSLNGVANALSVTGEANVLSGATLNANNTSFADITHQGEMNLSGSVHFAGTVEGTGTINNSGNLTFGTDNVKTFTGKFNQTDGKTIADSENFFQGANTISGGTLETKGNTIGYTATATENGAISFESTATDETVVHNANKIALSDSEVGNSIVSFKNGSYTLNDMGSGTAEDLIKFDNATVQLTANDYVGETYQFDNTTINMQDDIYSVVNMQNIAGSNTTLAVDIGLVSNAIDDGFNGVIAKSDVLNVTGDNAFVVANANFKVVPTGVNNQDANKDDGTSTSYTVQVLQGNATFADALKGSTSFNAVTNAYRYNAIISDDLQTVELKAFKTTDGNSLTHINQYAGNSNFYMSVDGETGSTYQMTSDLGATGIGEKLILGAVAGDASASIIDANNHSMFEVSDASTKLTVQDLTIKNATSILTMTNGNAILDNVIIDTLANTAPTVVIDNSSTSGAYGLVLNNVQINDSNALVANSGTMKSSNSNLQGVTNEGTFVAEGGTIETLNNAQDGNTTLSDVTNVDTIINDGVLTSSNSKLGTVTNNNGLTSTADTITSLDNTGNAELTDATVATLTNSGTLTAEGGTITTLTNQDGTARLTNTTVNSLTVNKGTLTATGGIIATLNNTQDGNTTLSGVTNVDAITNDGVLTSSNSKLGTVTNNNSLTSTADTITSLDNTGNAGLTTSSVATVKNKETGILTVQANSLIENASNLGTINVDNSTFGSVENNNQMIATGNLSITNALTGNGTLTMNGATLQVKDGFATSNNLVSNNMQFGEDIKTIEVANLTVQKDTNLDIRNIDVTAQEITLENGSTLNVQLNDRSDYGSLTGTNLISEEDSKIDFDLGENFEMGLYNVLKMDTISSLPIALHNDEGFNFLDLEDGRYSFISKDGSKISNQYGSDKNQTAAIIALHEGRGTNELFNKAQTELIEHLQSGNGALIKKAVKALDNLGGNVSPVVQSIAASHFKGITDSVSNQIKLVSGTKGTSGGDETSNAQVWVKALYSHSKYDDKSDFKANETGFVAGIQKQITDTLTVGVGYAYGNADIVQSGRDTTAQTNTGFAFAKYQPNKWFVEGVVSYSRSQYEETKNILSTASKGMYNVDTFAVQAMAGYDLDYHDLVVTPKFGLKYMNINQEAYIDSLDTHIGNNTYRYMTAMAGIDIRAPYKTVHGLYIRPTAGVMFGYDIISDDTGSINTLSNGAVYTAEGNALDRFSTNVNLGIDAELGDLTTLSVEYLGSFRKSYQEHGGMMKLKQNF